MNNWIETFYIIEICDAIVLVRNRVRNRYWGFFINPCDVQRFHIEISQAHNVSFDS
jgi:hypothetical protein